MTFASLVASVLCLASGMEGSRLWALDERGDRKSTDHLGVLIGPSIA